MKNDSGEMEMMCLVERPCLILFLSDKTGRTEGATLAVNLTL
jgi:hypothetical protein